MALERLQKILARAGVASRRQAEELIRAGRVAVDGQIVTEVGTKANPRRQRVELDGRLLQPEPLIYVLFHKPRGVVCTMHDPEGRATVAEYVSQARARVVPVGRLDYHTSGVLLLTNDGAFAASLAHPRRKVEKVYVAKVAGVLDDAAVQRWEESVEIDGRPTEPAGVRRLRVEGDKTWLEVTLREGRNRQIHRIAEHCNTMVLRLARIRFAGITAEGLRPGQWRYLSKDELTVLKAQYGVPRQLRDAPPLPNAEQIRKARAKGGHRGPGVVDGQPRRRAKAAGQRAAKTTAGQVTRGRAPKSSSRRGTRR